MSMPENFAEWPLRPELLAALADQGLVTPTPVQREAFQPALDGRDMLVQSRTGTGKTLAFGLPLLQRLQGGPGPIEALVVLPTRELAMQVALALGRMARPLGIEVAALYGGGAYRDQLRALGLGARLVVGTPGRLVDHLERGRLNLSACRALVLDEADEILDLGFAEELDKLLAALPAERQSLLFSATMAPGTAELAGKTLREPVKISLSAGGKSAPEIAHVAYACFADRKTDALVNVLHVDRPALAIVFCHTKAETEQIADRLKEEGFAAGFLNGDLPQEARTRTLNAFRRGSIDVLVATDVAARGLDVKGVTHVYNLGVPRDPESYVHRVGRTGRAGASGAAATFVPPRDAARFKRMLANAGVAVELRPLPQIADVRAKLREAYHEAINVRLAAGADPELTRLADELLAYVEPRDLVAALLMGDDAAKAALAAGIDVPVPWTPERAERAERPARAEKPPRERQRERPQRKLSEHNEPGMTRIWLNQGKAHKLMPGGLVKLICSVAGLKGDKIGAIAIHPYFSFVDVADAEAPRVVAALNGATQHGKRIKANVVPPVGEPQP